MLLDLHRFEISQIPRRFANFVREMVQFLDLRLREQQAAVFLGKFASARLRLAGQQALLVAVTEHVFDDRLDVLDLRTAFDVVVALASRRDG